MSVQLNDDFQDFILCLNAYNVDYLIVGGYAVIHYGHSRTTGDIDIWVRKSMENYGKLELSFKKFGMPVFDMTIENFLNNDDMDVFTFGNPPVCIDILSAVKGLAFDDAFQSSVKATWNEVPVNVIDLPHLILAKKTSARFKDLDDLDYIINK